MTDTHDIIRQGQALLKAGDLAGAVDLFEQSILKCREEGDTAGQIILLQPLSRIYEMKRETDRAVEANERLLSLYREADDRMGQGRSLSNLGLLYSRSKQYDEAIRHFEVL